MGSALSMIVRTHALALLGVLAAAPAFCAPITFNTALPVAKGETILRAQARYVRSTGDPTSLGRELTVWAFPVVGVYGVTERLAVFGVLPVLHKELDLNTPSGRTRRRSAGVGDMTFLARYTAWKRDRPGRTLRVAPFAGLEAPTGKDDTADGIGRLPRPLQPGSGSWDPLLGAVVTWQTLERQVDASASYKLNTGADGFRFGDEARFEVSYQERLWPRELDLGVPAYVYGVMESSILWQGNNETGGMDDPDSGGVSWFLTPGLQYVTRRVVAEAAVRLPVLQNLNGNALEGDYTAIFSMRVNF